MHVDTIVAVSTPRGTGGIAVVRLSGPDACRLLTGLAPGLGAAPEARRATLAHVHDPVSGELIDRCVVTVYRAPASFTGEDVVELSCHGSPLIAGLVVDACRAVGARPAEPGEFTRRAYLRGKIDLVQAEATGDLIEARSPAAHRVALDQLDRGLSRRISDLRMAIVRVEALLAHHIDFPEEDDAPVPLERVTAEAGQVLEQLEELLRTAPGGELLRDGALVVLAGRPNAGKSSLYNALVGSDRAIVTEEAGTTRDALETGVHVGGYPFRVVDTAGLRSTDERVERLGIEVAWSYVDRADVVVFCVPADEEASVDDRGFLERMEGRAVVEVATKVDRVAAGEADSGRLGVSALTGQGLGALADRLVEVCYGTLSRGDPEQPIITRRRHARALEIAKAEVEAFRRALDVGLPAEVAASHLRPAETALEELLGVVSVDDVLDVVFREFCVGK